MLGKILSSAMAGAMLLFCSTAQAQQQCDNSVPQTTPSSAFTDNGDGTVTDNLSGLMWKKCTAGLSGNDCATGTAGTYTWQLALQYVATLNADPGETYNDWRLPNIKELASIVELQCHSPAINQTLFPATPFALEVSTGLFWSATPSSVYQAAEPLSGRGQAWGVLFMNGETARDNKHMAGYVRLVRN